MTSRRGDLTLNQLFDAVKPFRLPPVAEWWPEQTVDFDLVIRRDGRWFHEGGEIHRRKLVKLLSTVLAQRDGEYFLVTPPVRYRITVEDTPFLVVEATVEGESGGEIIWLRTNVDETIQLDHSHRLNPRVDPESGEPSPVVTIRDGLTGRLTRTVYYQLAEMAAEHPADSGIYGILSAGGFHPLM